MRASLRRKGLRTHASGQTRWPSLIVFTSAAIAVVQFYQPTDHGFARPWARLGAVPTMPDVTPSENAFGTSGEVHVRFTLPANEIEIPLEVEGNPAALAYQWLRVSDSVPAGIERPLEGARFIAPSGPGFYRLAVVQGDERRILDSLTVGVLVPFSAKAGSAINGYKIGTYRAERLKSTERERPEGFVEVAAGDVDMPVSTHLRLADFIAHDGQQTWPRYAALSTRLLDKIELVIDELMLRPGLKAGKALAIDVHSGFRTPLHNRGVAAAASDSRHQYGDAADIAIDANGDGRFTATDMRLVSTAVETVEKKYPDLAGGLGLYSSVRSGRSYVHIDARGTKVRWRG